jgi:hypothetical protein
MTSKELISQTRLLDSTELPKHLVETFAFKPTEPLGENSIDLNLDFRIEVVEELLHDFSKKDLQLIRQLYKQELVCERLIWRHDNIYQLAYYLFELGQIEDCFLIYEAKYLINHMDISTIIDREMLTVGHNIDKVILFVEQKIKDDPELAENYEGIVKQLIDLKEDSDCDIEEYKKFIKGYYFGHDKQEITITNNQSVQIFNNQIITTNKSKKSWWKFW